MVPSVDPVTITSLIKSLDEQEEPYTEGAGVWCATLLIHSFGLWFVVKEDINTPCFKSHNLITFDIPLLIKTHTEVFNSTEVNDNTDFTRDGSADLDARVVPLRPALVSSS